MMINLIISDLTKQRILSNIMIYTYISFFFQYILLKTVMNIIHLQNNSITKHLQYHRCMNKKKLTTSIKLNCTTIDKKYYTYLKGINFHKYSYSRMCYIWKRKHVVISSYAKNKNNLLFHTIKISIQTSTFLTYVDNIIIIGGDG